MGLFKKDPLKEIFEDYDRGDFKDILETARAISGNDRRVAAAVNAALDNPKKYIKQNASRFSERGIELDDEDILDEFDSDEDFLWGLTQIKNHELIKDVLKTIELDEDGDIEKWGKQINKALGGKAYVCYMYIDSDSYPLTVVTPEAFEKIPLPFITVM